MRRLLLGLTLLCGCVGPTRKARAPRAAEPHLTMLTYNVNYGLGGDAAGVAAIAAADAEIVLLQETTKVWETAIRTKLPSQYPHVAFYDAPSAGGLAVLSKLPLSSVDVLEPKTKGSWFAAQRVVVKTALGPVQILNVHLRPQVSDRGSFVAGYFSTPKVRAREMAAHLERMNPQLLTIIAGDFNESGGGALEVLQKRNFANALPEFSPRETTWRWPTSVGEFTSQIDHVAYSRGLEPIEARVIKKGRSDHLPVYAVFVNR